MRRIYIIDIPGQHGGGLFLGDIEQFRDCFFDDVFGDDDIQSFCKTFGYVLEIRMMTAQDMDDYIHATVTTKKDLDRQEAVL